MMQPNLVLPLAVVLLGLLAGVGIGLIAWYNAKRPPGWENAKRPGYIPDLNLGMANSDDSPGPTFESVEAEPEVVDGNRSIGQE